MSRYYSWDNIISKSECEWIIKECKQGVSRPAQIGSEATRKIIRSRMGEGYSPDDYRKANVYWVDEAIPLVSKLITKLVYGFIHEANDAFFHYKITDHQKLQFGEYTVGGHYKYHKDTAFVDGNPVFPFRKLSVSVLLSDPKDFKGGEFLMYDGEMEPLKPLKGQGSVVVFDSRDFHKVEPVTSGVRHSLVMWATGPLFK
jgi:PKHD-type hydroxylase